METFQYKVFQAENGRQDEYVVELESELECGDFLPDLLSSRYGLYPDQYRTECHRIIAGERIFLMNAEGRLLLKIVRRRIQPGKNLEGYNYLETEEFGFYQKMEEA